MLVTSIGHAGLKVKTKNATLLLDPWMTPYGAFQGSWFQFPDNKHVLNDLEIFNPDAIVISHEHMDHLDPWFLAQVPSHVPVIIPKYPSPILKEKVLKGGERPIIEVNQWETYEIAEGTSVFFVSEPPMNHDSAIIIMADGKSLLDINDARLFPVQLRDIKQKVGGKIDIYTFQGAGASWYPICYEYPEDRSKKLAQQKRAAKFSYCLRSMKIVEPEIGLPFAGPPAFLDPILFQHNDQMENGIFPDQMQVAEYLKSRGLKNVSVLLPGETWDANNKTKIEDPHWKDFSFDNRWDYLKQYQESRVGELQDIYDQHPVPENSLWEDFQSYFKSLLTKSAYFNKRINMRVGFDIQGDAGGKWHVDFRPGMESVGEGLEDCNYLYRFDSRWLPPILNHEVPWEDFFLSLRFEASRNPDLYNDHLLGLLKFAHEESLQAVEKFESIDASDERITLHSEGKVYSVSRFCPHAGNDLLNTGEVLPGGILRCLAHHYDFDLETGECITASCDKLHVERIN